MEFAVSHHCMASSEGQALFLLGGRDEDLSNQVFVNYPNSDGNPTNWEQIPLMLWTRDSHSCGIISDSEMAATYYLVAFGGHVQYNPVQVMTDTTEALEITKASSNGGELTFDSKWNQKGDLPHEMGGIASIVTSDGKTLIALGGGRFVDNFMTSDILLLQCRDGTCDWKPSKNQKLQQDRMSAVAMIVPSTVYGV